MENPQEQPQETTAVKKRFDPNKMTFEPSSGSPRQVGAPKSQQGMMLILSVCLALAISYGMVSYFAVPKSAYNTNTTTLVNQIAAIQATVDSGKFTKGDLTAMQNSITGLLNSVSKLPTNPATQADISNLNSAIASLQSRVSSAQTDLASLKTTDYASIQSSIATLQTAVTTLQAVVAADIANPTASGYDVSVTPVVSGNTLTVGYTAPVDRTICLQITFIYTGTGTPIAPVINFPTCTALAPNNNVYTFISPVTTVLKGTGTKVITFTATGSWTIEVQAVYVSTTGGSSVF